MIIVRLMGGLGNQMFQYAAARRLALGLGTEVAFDLSHFDHCPDGDTPRNYELHRFAVRARTASPLDVAELSGIYRTKGQMWLVRLRRLAGLCRYQKHLYQEAVTGFSPEFYGLTDNVYMVGYWHSEKYFVDVANAIRQELTVVTEPSARNQELLQFISATESVALHFRRGDYVSSPKTAAFHGVLDQSYYTRAIDLISERVASPRLFVFSDDPAWVRQNVTFPFPAEIVDHNPPEQGFEDLRLMACCRHAIIANSSFSWWGGWLIRNPGKVVIAPTRWFASAEQEPNDLIPDGWVRV